ncbi:MAG: HD domain-containing protein [Candidatus Pacebacteria bacterium]|nr:HD domain-containing protein [Candidatus Paceibacterota bacterium]
MSATERYQRIRDPIHSVITFDMQDEFEKTMWDVVQTPTFQRLRRIKQLGFSELVYPGATHSRFAHSLGVFHTARQLAGVIAKNSTRSESKERIALAAALLHDVGHGPFSHAYEGAISIAAKKYKFNYNAHEHMSLELILNSEIGSILSNLGSGFAQDVAMMVNTEGKVNTNEITSLKNEKKPILSIYNSIVSSQFDADRLDYMRRDRFMTGTQHAGIDFDWILSNLEVGKVPIGTDDNNSSKVQSFVINPKNILAIEAYILGNLQLHQTVYFHKTTRGIEKFFTELVLRIFYLLTIDKSENIGLTNNNPIIKLFSSYIKGDFSYHHYNLDDSIFYGSLPLLENSEDEVIRFYSQSIKNRQIYSCIDVYKILQSQIYDEVRLDERISEIKTKVISEFIDKNNEIKSVIMDEGDRNPYKLKQENYPFGSIIARTGKDSFKDISMISKVIKSLETYKFLRFYVRRDQDEIINSITKIITG